MDTYVHLLPDDLGEAPAVFDRMGARLTIDVAAPQEPFEGKAREENCAVFGA
jgi:hypothetical protein